MTNSQLAKQFYDENLRTSLEAEQLGSFVAVIPELQKHYVGKDYVRAAMQARQEHPDHLPFVIKVGSEAANHIGVAE